MNTELFQSTDPRIRRRTVSLGIGAALLAGILLGAGAMRVRMAASAASVSPPPACATRSAAPRPGPAAHSPAAVRDPAVASAPSGAMRLVLEDNRRLRGQLEDLLNWILDNFQGHVPLSETILARLNLPVLDDSGVLHPDLESFLHITPDERAALNQALTTARAAMTALRRSGMEVEFPDARRMVALFPAAPEAGGRVREQLYADLDVVLGNDRFDRLLQTTQPEMRRAFDDFGLSERRIEFAVTHAADPAEERLEIRDEIRTPEADGSIRMVRREISASDVPKEYQFLFSPDGTGETTTHDTP